MSADTLVIRPCGPLHGTVTVNGAKNAVLPIMAACLLTAERSVIENVPHVTDVLTMIEILRGLGVAVEFAGDRLTVAPGRYTGTVAAYDLVSRMRASVCVLGPLLARHGRAQVSMPGGCVIGPRPIDLHLKGLQALGASFTIEHGYVVGTTQALRGGRVYLSGAFGSSVLATGNVMMAATLAPGTTVIEHAACEPEVVDLANFLSAMGACIEGQGSPVIRVEGVPRLRGVRYRIIPDRIEAGTLMIAAAIVGGDLAIDGALAEHLGAVIDKLSEAGAQVEKRNGSIRVQANHPLRSVEVTTLPFPGFPTDLQAQMMALMAVSRGVSVLTEKVYPERFMHISELNRMGASITREGSSAIVKGVSRLSGAPVTASDLRASAALMLAGMAAENQTELRGLEHLDRGYQDLEAKLVRLGASIERVSSLPATG
ncbi:MAG: UDP-N-acetylglucosamine 1-carboxyvinyltransferase [Omnitrophica WOR_2 bacterium RIFCSPHIGHO2_02_FULL_67_20]|nr:MAG: UDP-N-acetylglucosamine 1-carboxyvinyltransferase [Omnitrophica WOR_2 bacterium RIFCSPHIGHO2_02_FULL_67_20]